MNLNQAAAVVALTVGTLPACGTNDTPSQRNSTKAAIERPSSLQEDLSAETSTSSAPYVGEKFSKDGANASCMGAGIIFYCTAMNSKEIKLCDRSKTIEYSFGETGKTPELVLSVPREEATTSQWEGIGRWIYYSITIPSGDTKYTVFTSADRISDKHEFEAGVIATVGDAEVARILCREPITHNIEGVDLKQAD